jgi:hypothetical protein
VEEEKPGTEAGKTAEMPAAAPQPPETKPPAAAAPLRSAESRVERTRAPRPEMIEPREPVYRESEGYTLRLDPPDLARLRELPGSKGKTDRELGELFFDGQAERLTGAVSGDVPVPAELRVVVDPYSRQAFLAVGKTIRGIVSF